MDNTYGQTDKPKALMDFKLTVKVEKNYLDNW